MIRIRNRRLRIFCASVVFIYLMFKAWLRSDVHLTEARSAAPFAPSGRQGAGRVYTLPYGGVIELENPCDPSKDPIVNPHPFRVLLENTSLCAHPNLFLFVYVHSAPENADYRQRIRHSYGNTSSALYRSLSVVARVMFVVGVPRNTSLSRGLRAEAAEHGDIYQESYVDDYLNLTYKSRGAMGWVASHCAHARYVLKCDDDEFVNIVPLLRHLQALEASGHGSGLLLCAVWPALRIERSGKWAVDEAVLPARYTRYPPYCSGQAYLYTPDVARTLHNASFYVPFLWVDDAYLTGVLVHKTAGRVRHVNIRPAVELADWLAEMRLSRSAWHEVFFTETHDHERYARMWALVAAKSASYTATGGLIATGRGW